MWVKQPRQGFTLIEVLIVLLIASIVLTVLATVLASSFEILRTGETRAQLNATARNALDYLVDDISTASYIPRMEDRDLNGYDDGDSLPADGGFGYDLAATWTVGREIQPNVIVVDASYFLSEACSDHIMTMHDNRAFSVLNNMVAQAHDPPKVIAGVGGTNAISYKSFFRLVHPASAEFPYLLASEHDRNGDGQVTGGDLLNTGSIGGQIYGYPDVVPVGNHKETAVLIQDLFYKLINKDTNAEEQFVRRVRQLPIASDITRVNFAYYHSVPVFQSRVNGNQIEIAYQDITNGELRWAPADSALNSNLQYNAVPLLARWEMRQIDVAYDTQNIPDPTGAVYGGNHYALADMYPEGYDNRKLNGTNTTVGIHVGLQSWNCHTFYNTDSNGDQVSDNAPPDRVAYVTSGLDSNGTAMDGGMAALRPDFQPILGGAYYQQSLNPTGIGDFGDADGIPDGDGVPDDPVPGWWLPYLRAVRVTVTATPRSIIEERRNMSGKAGHDGTILFYRLDSPIPYLDRDRTQPVQERKRDYIGMGKDLVLTKMVPVKYAYAMDLVCDPLQYRQLWAQITGSPTPNGTFARRVEWNFFNGAEIMSADPYDPGAVIKARDAAQKYLEKR